MGLEIHLIHLLFACIEVSVVSRSMQYKFCILHQIFHEIKPIYNIVHVEHHLCKGTYPTTPAVGLWEIWIGSGSLFFTVGSFSFIPYLFLQSIYMGPNLITHAMWPIQTLLQWHTLHHTIIADAYAANIPSPYDKEHSKSVIKLQKNLEYISPFIKYESLSDIVGILTAIITGLIFHYIFEIGIGQLDWNRVEWTYY